MRRTEAWKINRSFHHDDEAVRLLRAYVGAGVTSEGILWDRDLQYTAAELADFGGKPANAAISARSRATQLVDWGWLTKGGERRQRTLSLTELGERVLRSYEMDSREYRSLARLSRLQFERTRADGKRVFPCLTTLYLLVSVYRIDPHSAYLMNEDIRHFVIWLWQDPRVCAERQQLDRVAQEVAKAHATTRYPRTQMPHYDPDSPRHFMAHFAGAGLFEFDGTSLRMRESTVSSACAVDVDWSELWSEIIASALMEDDSISIDVEEPTSRVSYQIERIIRNTEMVRELKTLYASNCQVCGKAIETPTRPYGEGHHLKPLGNPHSGPDVAANVLILCPNHHAMFDLCALALSPKDKRTLLHFNPSAPEHGVKLISKHTLRRPYVEYHLERLWKPSVSKAKRVPSTP